MKRTLLQSTVALVLLLSLIALPESAFAQAAPAGAAQQPEGPFPDLVGGLRETEGCLGVESATTDSGKQVIFAWFENKQAVLNWYHSDMHQDVMSRFFPNRAPREALADIPENSGPIMAIASITFTDKPQLEATPLPISQIAIELYSPVSGGLFLGGKFAPDSLKVKGIKDYSAKNKD